MKGIKNNKTVGFIGAGNLGRHAIEKLAEEYSLLVHDPFEDQRIIDLGVEYTDLNELVEKSETIFLTVKPNKVEEITNQLKNSLGQKLSLNFDVDKTIIGGLIVKVGSKMIDTSIANKINKLRIAMKGA